MDDVPPRAPLRVLVAEHYADAAESMAALLRLWGHDARVARDGHSALGAAGAFLPQVVLLDLELAGPDGHQVARGLRQNPSLRDTCVIGVTSYARPADRSRAREAGCAALWLKPVDPEVLRGLLDVRCAVQHSPAPSPGAERR